MHHDDTDPRDLGGIIRYVLRWHVAPPDNIEITIVDRVTTFLSRIAMTLTAVIVVIMTFEVTSRYVFFSPTLWLNETAVWLGAMIYLMAGVYAMQQRSHIRITVFYDIVPRSVQRVFDFIAMVVVLLYVFAMVWSGWQIAFRALTRWEKLGTALNPPVPATIKPLVLVAAILIAIQAINNFVIDVRKDRGEGASTTPGVD